MKDLADVESYENFFMLGVKDFLTKKIKYFEISEYRDDSAELFEYLNTFKGYFISFNGLHYDKPVLSFFAKNYLLKGKVTTQEIKAFSDLVIVNGNNNNIKSAKEQMKCEDKKGQKELFELVKELEEENKSTGITLSADQIRYKIKEYLYIFDKDWIDTDLFLYNSKGIRLSKKISLKSLGVALGHEEIQELPYHHTKWLTKEEIEEVRHYNLYNDLGILDKLCVAKEKEIELRRDIKVKMGFDTQIYSWDTPKIASEILLDTLHRADGRSKWDLRNLRYDKPTLYFGELLKGIDFGFKTPQFIDIYNYVCKAVNTFSHEFKVIKSNDTALRISIGMGGIHSINSDEKYESDNDNIIVTSDFGSLYPNLLRKFNCFRYQSIQAQYNELIRYRLDEVKPNIKKFKGTSEENKWKKEDAFAKLILNSTSGLIDQQYSYLYYPEGAMRMRLCGQLIMLKSIECFTQEGFNVVEVNTDGVTSIIKKADLDKYHAIANKIADDFNLVFEHEEYKSIRYKSVNSYIAIYENGYVKKKGEFVTNPNLEDGWDELVIPKVVEMYYTKGIPIREILNNPYEYGLHIYDFTLSKKVGKQFILYWNGAKVQNLNRFYISKKGAYLYKQKAQGKMENVLKGFPIMIYNKHEEKSFKEYEVYLPYYIQKIEKIINVFDNNQINLFK